MQNGSDNLLALPEDARKSRRTPANLDTLVLQALCGRMDPATRRVAPKWRALAAGLGVCVMTLAKSVRRLKAGGYLSVVPGGEPSHAAPCGKLYRIHDKVDVAQLAGIVPEFRVRMRRVAARRGLQTQAELDAQANARLAARAKSVMADFLARMDPKTHRLAPQLGALAKRLALNPVHVARIVRVFKAAGLVSVARDKRVPGAERCGFVFEVDTRAVEGLDYLKLASSYRLKTVHPKKGRGREKILPEDLDMRILDRLRANMAPGTGLVKPKIPDLAREMGVSQAGVVQALKSLVEAKRLAPVVGRARRGLGAGGHVYRVVEKAPAARDIRVRVQAASAPRAIPGRILTALRLENFKNSGKTEVVFDRVSVVGGGFGSARSQVFDAMRFLHGISHGRPATSAPAAWFGCEWPTKILVSFNTLEYGELTYAVTLQRLDETRLGIVEETLGNGRQVFLRRRKHAYIVDDVRGKYGIDPAHFALYEAAQVLEGENPVRDMKDVLGQVWMLDPDPGRMVSDIGFRTLDADDTGFANLTTCIALQQHNQPAIGQAVMDAICRISPDVAGYSIERNTRGLPYFAIHHKNDLDAKGTPFHLAGNDEKMLFLAAFVCAMNEHVSPLQAVWDSPRNWLSPQDGAAVVRLLRQSFANRGQLVMLA